MNLQHLLDDLELPDTHVADGAWDRARDRQRRRTGLLAAGAAATAMVAVVAAVTIVGSDAPRDEPVRPVAPSVTTPSTEARTWPTWDPKDVDSLPGAPDDLAPELPDVLDPPTGSVALADAPVSAAVAVVAEQGTVQLLDAAGEWRSVPREGRYPIATLSPGGTRLAVTEYATHTITVHDVTTGESRELPAPADTRRHEVTWQFLDDETLLLTGAPTTYEIDAADGRATPTQDRPPLGAEEGGLMQRQENGGTVAGLTYQDGPFRVVVTDRRTSVPDTVLPVKDRQGAYSNGGVGTLALRDDGVLLLRVARLGRDVEGFVVVAWDPATDQKWEVTRMSRIATVHFASDFLRR